MHSCQHVKEVAYSLLTDHQEGVALKCCSRDAVTQRAVAPHKSPPTRVGLNVGGIVCGVF